MKLHTKGRHCSGSKAQVEGDIFKFKGDGGSVGVVKILEPMNPIYNYFEYQILARGAKCAIGIGVGEQNYPVDRMPGWNRNGLGYHADDGRLFHQDGYGKQFGPTCTEGDRMGCGVDFDTDVGYGYCEVFFTKNGQPVGNPVKMKRPVYGLYPIIGLHSRGEKVRYLGHWHRQRHSLLEPMIQDHSPSNVWLRSNNVKFLEDGLTLEYSGDGLNRQDVGIAQGNVCIDQQHHYFEISLLSSGKEGWFALGLAHTTYPLHRHPGWNTGSVGYHADNGHLYKERGHGEPFGPTCTEGDVMGCGIAFPVDSSESREAVIGATAATPPLSSDSESEDEEVRKDLVLADMEQYYYDELFDYTSGEDYDSDDQYHFLQDRGVEVKRKGAWDVENYGSKRQGRDAKTCLVYFTKNGERVGETECVMPKGGFYPVVAMLSQGERVRVDFNPLTG